MKIKNVLLEKTTVELDSGKNCAILYPALLVITGFSWELKAVKVPNDTLLTRGTPTKYITTHTATNLSANKL